MKPLPLALGIGITLVVVTSFGVSVSALAEHIVISEVQSDGATAGDEFVELHNPTDTVIDMTGWRLTRKNESGAQANLVASISGSIQPHGYFLIARPTYDGEVLPDLPYSATSSSFANNGTILLYSDAGITLVDKVGMGTASDFETAAAPSPSDDGSIERILGQDTDDNSADFVLRTVSDPQNSQSVVTLPTPTITPSPTVTVTVTATPSPTSSPTPTSTPTDEPTPTSTTSPTPTPVPPPLPNFERFVFKLLRSILRPIFRF